MAFDTLRTNKLRSALTILGVVIGVRRSSAMTALIRGFAIRSCARSRSPGRRHSTSCEVLQTPSFAPARASSS